MADFEAVLAGQFPGSAPFGGLLYGQYFQAPSRPFLSGLPFPARFEAKFVRIARGARSQSVLRHKTWATAGRVLKSECENAYTPNGRVLA